MKTLSVRTSASGSFENITSLVQQSVTESGINEGMCFVYIPHTTAGITINEAADPDVVRDMLMELNKIVPLSDGYAHAEGNSAAHIKSSMMGFTASVPVSGGRLVLGTWQGIYLCEFDGPRTRRVHIQFLGA